MSSVSTIINALLEKFSNDEGQLVIPQDELVKALGSMKAEKSGRVKRAKKEKDPDAPKRPPSAYMLWLNENRQAIKEKHFPVNEDGEHTYPSGHDKSRTPLKGKDKVTLIAKKAGDLWKEMTNEEKKPYKSEATKLSDAYKTKKMV